MTAPRDERAEREAQSRVREALSVDYTLRLQRVAERLLAASNVLPHRFLAEQCQSEAAYLRETSSLLALQQAVTRHQPLATSRARLERVVEGLRKICTDDCYDYDFNDRRFRRCSCEDFNAALDAVRTAMQGEG